MENIRKHRNILLVTAKKRRYHLMSDANYHKLFLNKLLAIEIKKAKGNMIKPVYLGLSILKTIKRRIYGLMRLYKVLLHG